MFSVTLFMNYLVIYIPANNQMIQIGKSTVAFLLIGFFYVKNLDKNIEK